MRLYRFISVRGRGASLSQRSQIVRNGGVIRSENVGMSNRKEGESPSRRKSKVSLAMTIIQGLGDPKLSTKRCLCDGQTVNILSLRFVFNKVTESSIFCRLLDFCSWHKALSRVLRKLLPSGGGIKVSALPRKAFAS